MFTLISNVDGFKFKSFYGSDYPKIVDFFSIKIIVETFIITKTLTYLVNINFINVICKTTRFNTKAPLYTIDLNYNYTHI